MYLELENLSQVSYLWLSMSSSKRVEYLKSDSL